MAKSRAILPKYGRGADGSPGSDVEAHLRIHSHCHLSKRTGARLERLQPRIDGLEGAVDASSDMRGHQSLHGPLRCQGQTALEEYFGAGVERVWFREVA